ncbi:MAG: MBL fold metallo-hydrolase [Opitutales bacterium]|nr:MBL fold metallo-hydrolase [Opitutales bacterium]
MIGWEVLVCDVPYRTNVYYRMDEKSRCAVVIDAAPSSFAALSKRLKGYHIQVFLTHAHWDHIADAKRFQSELKATIFLHAADVPLIWNQKLQSWIADGKPYEPFVPDKVWKKKTTLSFGGLTFRILPLPGHTPGSVGIYDEKHRQLFSGDTLFYRNIGRTDLGGSMERLKDSLQVLSRLPPETVVYPGHGMPTTIEQEKDIFARFQKR